LKGVDAVDRSLCETRKRLASLHPVLLAEVEKQNADSKLEAKNDHPELAGAKPSLIVSEKNSAGNSEKREDRNANAAPFLT
jgi:hypothetical protein